MEKFLRSRLAEEFQGSDVPVRPSLTLSRQCGTGTSKIERSLVEYLDEVDESAVHGWAGFDQSLIGKIIEDHKLPKEMEPYLMDEAKFPILETLEEALRLQPSKWNLFHYSASTIRTLCRMGNALVVGRAGNFVTSDLANTFHVRLIGSELRRIARVRERFQMSQDEAEHLVQKTDRSRSHFVKRYTGSDIDDTGSYHLVLNTDNLSPDVIVRIVGDSVIEWANGSNGKEDLTDRLRLLPRPVPLERSRR
ncbi:MAG: cytidylate kinase-like family protein [Verrucomicrobiota bacterium]